jgi:hypothetical protein
MLLLDRYLGFHFFHQWGRRQRDEVRKPDLDLGSSRSLHSGAAGLRHLLRGVLDIFRQAVVRLPLDGARDHGDLRPLLHGVAASAAWPAVLLAVPPADFVLHNSLFLVAHFHSVIIGGVLFGAFAGYTYWFPKIFRFKLHEGPGHAAFWCWLIGF